MNSEPRQLPTIKIHDTEFHVDIRLMEFRQVSNSDNVISFKNVQDNIDHTAVLYDPKTKNAFQGTWQEMSARKDVVLVKLPCIIETDHQQLSGCWRTTSSLGNIDANCLLSGYL